MVLTVRQRGQLMMDNGEVIDDVVATVWFEGNEEHGPWGGIIEPQVAASVVSAQVLTGQIRYRLRLEDGREGAVKLGLSEFDADGAHPLTFAGQGVLGRQIGTAHG
jgi:hypothetical protein